MSHYHCPPEGWDHDHDPIEGGPCLVCDLRADLARVTAERDGFQGECDHYLESASKARDDLARARGLLERWMSDGRFVEEGERGCVVDTRAFLAAGEEK